MNIRGPFGEPQVGPFTRVVMEARNRPKVTYRGVRVMRHDEHDLTQVDEYPDATGWEVDGDGQLDVWCENAQVSVVATYPSGAYRRVWFPGAELKATFELPADNDVTECTDVEPNEG